MLRNLRRSRLDASCSIFKELYRALSRPETKLASTAIDARETRSFEGILACLHHRAPPHVKTPTASEEKPMSVSILCTAEIPLTGHFSPVIALIV
jgi:hypothetical protein